MTTILDEPTTTGDVLAELGGLFDILPADELELVKQRLRDRKQTKERSAYHKALVDRTNGKKVELPHPHPTYQLMGGIHQRYSLKAIQDNYKQCAAARESSKITGLPVNLTNPEQEEFRPGATFAPESDGEALLCLQDPDKFRPMGKDKPADRISELLAENTRSRQQMADRDGEIERQKAENARLLAELEAARKKNGSK